MKNYIALLRKEFGFSQQDLAYIIGCSRNTITSIETGASVPSLVLAFKIASAFGVDIYDVFNFRDTLDTLKSDVTKELKSCYFDCLNYCNKDMDVPFINIECPKQDCPNYHNIELLRTARKNMKSFLVH